MATSSRVNPNFPIPGLDQSSKGFRDNFATIKSEIEALQGTTIQLMGGVVSDPYQLGDESVVIETTINGGFISLAPPDRAIQFNDGGRLAGDPAFVYDSRNISVGIGTPNPDPNFGLDVKNGVITDTNIVVMNAPGDTTSQIFLNTPNVNASFSNYDTEVIMGSFTPTPLVLFTNSTTGLVMDETQRIGIGTTSPAAVLDVMARSRDMGIFRTSIGTADNMIRMTTNAANSTVGLGLENRLGDALGGIRIDQGGTLSLHSGESMDAFLSTSTARLIIDRAGKVGIGKYDPGYNLDVNGTTRTTDLLVDGGDLTITNSISFAIPPVTVNASPLVIDAWPILETRSARYTVQVVNGAPPTENIEITDLIVTHVNMAPLISTIHTFNSGTPLGTINATIDGGGYMEVTYVGNAPGNLVRISKIYMAN